VAFELRTFESPLERVAGVALRGEQFVTRIARVKERYGTEAALHLLARRGLSFALRAGSSAVCAWHDGMARPEIKPLLGATIEEVASASLPEVVALMRSAGWRDPQGVVERRIAEGKRCFAARWGGSIVAQLWTSRSSHNYEELWDMRLGADEARTFDWYTLPDARGRRLIPALLSLSLGTLRSEGAKHIYTSIGGDNFPSLRAAEQVLPMRRDFVYFMVRGMRRPVVPGMAHSTHPTLDPVERPFERINVTNLVV
jgi:hypothetical protein